MAARLRDAFHIREVLYPSNVLTYARLLLLPSTLRALWKPQGSRRALLLMLIAMATDAVDGPIARMRGEESSLGQILDPIADKLVLDATAFTLSRRRGFPWWITGLLIFRDIGILLGALLVYRRKSHITLSQSAGKATTVALTAAALCYTADGPRSGRPVLLAALVPFVISFWQYGRRFVGLIRS